MACLYPSVDRSRIYCDVSDTHNIESSDSDILERAPLSDERSNPVRLFKGKGVSTPYSSSRLDESLHRFVPDLSKRLRSQVVWDQEFPDFVPKLFQDQDEVLIGTERVLISYRSTLSRTGESVVMEVTEFQEYMAKFVNNCADLVSIHPSLREYWILRDIEDLNIAPHALFISPPVKLVRRLSAKTDFRLPADERRRCAKSDESHVRLLVMDKQGPTLTECFDRSIFDKQASFSMGILIMKDLVAALKQLHAKRIIHGNVYPDTVIFMPGERIGLTGFDKARYASEFESLTDVVGAPFEYIDCFSSMYEMKGFRTSYRDDVFMAILTGAMVIGGIEMIRFCTDLEEHPEALLGWKESEFLFNYYGGPDAVESLANMPFEGKKQIGLRLESILWEIRHVDRVNHFPNYDSIIFDLSSIESWLDKVYKDN